MELTTEEEKMLSGEHGRAVQQSMEILCALGKVYGADRLIPVSSVQVAGVSYDNLGEAGLEYLDGLAKDGKVKVLTTLNPAGMDLEDWKRMGIKEDFAKKQLAVISAFKKMGITISCTCTPYFVGNAPSPGDHVAWSESSAVCYANSVLGARTNREGGPSALAAALTGRTPNYGLHLDGKRKPGITAYVKKELNGTQEFGALGMVLGKRIGNSIPLIRGVKEATKEELKSLCASIATYGGTALFHMEGITPEKVDVPEESIEVGEREIKEAIDEMNDQCDPDFVYLGCPHLSLGEIKKIAGLLEGKKVKTEFWLGVARKVKEESDKLGYTKTIEDAGAILACDMCPVVAPIKGRFKCMATDSAKACYYARAKNRFMVRIGSMEQCIEAAVAGKWK